MNAAEDSAIGSHCKSMCRQERGVINGKRHLDTALLCAAYGPVNRGNVKSG